MPTTDKHFVIKTASTRSPRGDWSRWRSANDAMTALEHNHFRPAKTDVGVAYVRVCGLIALRVTIANGHAVLDTAPVEGGPPIRWKPARGNIGVEPWQVVREALELVATLDVDTPVQWG